MAVGEQAVHVLARGIPLEGSIVVPRQVSGLVVFAHGGGSTRLSPRNRYVAGVLQSVGLATLLVDLLTAHEQAADQRTGRLRFDIALLAERLIGAIHWSLVDPRLRGLPVGAFGASTGAAAALIAAAREPDRVRAVVSRGGRPELAGEDLASVRAPTLLIAGDADSSVVELNRGVLRELRLSRESSLEIVPRAGHLFAERGALERVAELAASWFARHLDAAGLPYHENMDGSPRP